MTDQRQGVRLQFTRSHLSVSYWICWDITNIEQNNSIWNSQQSQRLTTSIFHSFNNNLLLQEQDHSLDRGLEKMRRRVETKNHYLYRDMLHIPIFHHWIPRHHHHRSPQLLHFLVSIDICRVQRPIVVQKSIVSKNNEFGGFSNLEILSQESQWHCLWFINCCIIQHLFIIRLYCDFPGFIVVQFVSDCSPGEMKSKVSLPHCLHLSMIQWLRVINFII